MGIARRKEAGGEPGRFANFDEYLRHRGIKEEVDAAVE